MGGIHYCPLPTVTIAELAARYSITVASAKARVQFLSLDLKNIDKADLQKLDALDEHLDQGQPIATFSFTPTAEVEVVSSTKKSRSTKKAEIVPVTTAEPLAIEPIQAPIPTLANLEQLEKIYTFLQKATDNNWHLPTSVIRSVIGAAPKGKRWKRFGFVFEPATRHGGERAWAVSQAEWDFPIE